PGRGGARGTRRVPVPRRDRPVPLRRNRPEGPDALDPAALGRCGRVRRPVPPDLSWNRPAHGRVLRPAAPGRAPPSDLAPGAQGALTLYPNSPERLEEDFP